MLNCLTSCGLCCVEVTIGFEETLYNVMEDVGSLEVCAVLSGMSEQDIEVTVTSADGTATSK